MYLVLIDIVHTIVMVVLYPSLLSGCSVLATPEDAEERAGRRGEQREVR